MSAALLLAGVTLKDPSQTGRGLGKVVWSRGAFAAWPSAPEMELNPACRHEASVPVGALMKSSCSNTADVGAEGEFVLQNEFI